MPDGGVGEAEIADAVFFSQAADDAAFGAEALGTTESLAAAGVTAGAAAGAAAGAVTGEAAVGGGAPELDTTGSLATGGGATETVGAGPSVAATQADSQTKMLADQILNGPAHASPELDATGSLAQSATPVEQVGAPELDTTGSMAENGGTGAAPVAPGAQAAKPGIVQRAMNFAEKNPVLATVAGTTVAGAVGGIGKAALEKEIAQRNIKARSDLLSQQYAQVQQQSKGGVYSGAAGVTPGRKILLRPDGTPVFAPSGIVNSQIG